MLTRLATLALSAVLLAPAANAAIISIPAAAFQTTADPNDASPPAFPEFSDGILFPGGPQILVAPVDFPKDGQKICRFTLLLEDANGGEDLRARLMRKSAVVGASSVAPPKILATVVSGNQADDVVMKASTKNISPRTINEKTGFYYVQIENGNANLDIIGVQIEVKSTCP